MITNIFHALFLKTDNLAYCTLRHMIAKETISSYTSVPDSHFLAQQERDVHSKTLREKWKDVIFTVFIEETYIFTTAILIIRYF